MGPSPLRLRHPKGVSTIQVVLDSDSFTVLDLQQEIYAMTDILPSRQSLKCGYPPKALDLIPELPLSSLGIKSGEQLIVSEVIQRNDRGPSTQPVASSPSPAAGGTGVPSSNASPLSGSTPASQPTSTKSSGPDHVETQDGSFLIHRIVPDDNSCLFSSIAVIFEQDISKASQIRQIVAESIKKDGGETYNEGILGMPPPQYISTILKPSTWGGAIELTVLANHYKTEIASIDVETGRVDRFSPPNGGQLGDMRCLVIYSGIHYDAATLAPMVDAPSEWHQTMFPIGSDSDASDPVLSAGKKLADILRSKKAFTNTATFTLKCENCGKGLTGEKEARVHAKDTGHTSFGEY